MSGIWQLEVTGDFSSAHALRNYQGKCERPHGHNFAVAVCVAGSRLDEKTEILIDFKILRRMLKDTLDELDHKMLNDDAPFDRINPSSENLARHIWRQMKLKLEDSPAAGTVQMVSVKVSEKPGQSASYME